MARLDSYSGLAIVMKLQAKGSSDSLSLHENKSCDITQPDTKDRIETNQEKLLHDKTNRYGTRLLIIRLKQKKKKKGRNYLLRP